MWMTALSLVLLSAEPKVELVAHRGESKDAPENTIAAFRLAWERGVRAIELDVHRTRDGALVVCHDADTKRVAGVERRIDQSTLAELRALDVGRWRGSQWEGERMPELGQVLATIPDGARCFIEIKVGPEAVPPLVDAVRASGKRPAQLVLISFQDEALAEAKRRLPELEAYLLSGFKQDESTRAWSPSADELIRRARAIHADGLDLSSKGPVDAAFVRQVKHAGLAMHVWTIDDPEEVRRFVAAGVDGITTNRPAWIREQLEKP